MFPRDFVISLLILFLGPCIIHCAIDIIAMCLARTQNKYARVPQTKQSQEIQNPLNYFSYTVRMPRTEQSQSEQTMMHHWSENGKHYRSIMLLPEDIDNIGFRTVPQNMESMTITIGAVPFIQIAKEEFANYVNKNLLECVFANPPYELPISKFKFHGVEIRWCYNESNPALCENMNLYVHFTGNTTQVAPTFIPLKNGKRLHIFDNQCGIEDPPTSSTTSVQPVPIPAPVVGTKSEHTD